MTPRARWGVVLALGLSSGAAWAEDAGTPKAASPLVDATTVVKDLGVDLRYATADNFLKKKVYPDTARCLLLPESAQRLKKAADVLRAQGYRLKVYDCYRPRAVQYQMWEIMPVPGYVANPRTGSNHNRGGAVDLTLTTLDGKAVEMPTPFDTFTRAAHHGYTGGTEASRKHREILREAMEGAGFKRNRMEWWHYDLPDARKRPVLDVPFSPP
ncbi:D-alanyl-D-alanine dipeptidase [Corallococcus macrosporus]|uniref:D-alanyl-D-alanine dipeptidase n=1 Tax=Corallococcus macrosporus DSM 14697 TaxID=1189310 RepID=A0A250K3C4_9BACT|nr:D-alanyl-D-alanine dipeptidase [Corallococcus macrosporus]ATB50468.1 D-alanyl-D-alanine dipeptidase [Corallococcus macrosporus DSM 14697]